MPGKTAAPHEIPFALESDEPPSMEAATKPQAEQVHKRLNEIAPKQITGVAEKQLLIANASGVVTAVTASGDVTNDKSGVFTIGSNAVTPDKMAKSARELLGLSNTGEVRSGKSIISAEGTRATATFGALSNGPDRVSNLILPTDGLIEIIAHGNFWGKASAEAAIFIGENQLKASNVEPVVQSAQITAEKAAGRLITQAAGLIWMSASANTVATTGQAIGAPDAIQAGMAVYVFAEAGTYNVDIRYKGNGEANSAAAKNRKLWVRARAFA